VVLVLPIDKKDENWVSEVSFNICGFHDSLQLFRKIKTRLVRYLPYLSSLLLVGDKAGDRFITLHVLLVDTQNSILAVSHFLQALQLTIDILS
jgi:hypothetical protein